jgi:serine/threonine protein kinase
MVDYRLNINKKHNLLNYNECKKLIYKSNFFKIDNGKQGEIFKAVSDKCGSVIIKKAGRDKYDKEKNKKLLEKLVMESKILFTIKRKLIDTYVCPNFIKIYDFIKNEKLLILEFADGNCSKLLINEIFCNNNEFSSNVFWSFICQIIMALLSLHKIALMVHHDLHFGNILYKRINKNIVFCYNVNNKKYYVPSYGFLFMITDFGSCLEIEQIIIDKNAQYAKKNKFFDINKYIERDINYFILSVNSTVAKYMTKFFRPDFINFEDVFSVNNKQIFKKLIDNGSNIFRIINYENEFDNFTIPVFDKKQLIKYNINCKIIDLINILMNDCSLLNLFKKIYDTNFIDNNLDVDTVVTFTINF